MTNEELGEYCVQDFAKRMPVLDSAIRADERRVMAEEIKDACVCRRCEEFCLDRGGATPCSNCPIRKAVEG